MLKRLFFIVVIPWTFLVTASCSQKNLAVTKPELIKYLNKKEHGLSKEQIVNGIKVELCYQPASLLVSQELEKDNYKDSAVIHALERKYSNNLYFLLKFSKDGKEVIRQIGSFSNYSAMVTQLSFHMNEYVTLTTASKDTANLNDYLFDQTYGLAGANTMLLSFDRNKILNAESFDIRLAECGLGTGNMQFAYSRSDLDHIPLLNYHSLY